MKKTIFITFFLSVLYSVYPQSGKVTYVASMKPYFEAMDREVVEKSMAYIDGKHTNKDVLFLMNFNDKESLFYLDDEMEIDEDKGMNITKILAGRGIYYYNKETQKTLREVDFIGELFLITCNKINWTLTNESKKIGKYKCFKAISEIKVNVKNKVKIKNIVAWYTPDIPISFGPKKYNGLPGLILVLQEGNLFFSAIKIEVTKDNNQKIKKLSRGEKITEDEYKKTIKNIMSDRKAYKKKYLKYRESKKKKL